MISIKSVLVPVDFSKESTLAVKFATSLAQQYGSKLYLLHVLEPLHTSFQVEIGNLREFEERRRATIREDLSRIIPAEIKKSLGVEEILKIGSPVYHVIAEKAEELDVELIVIPTHGRTGLSHILLGSVAEKVIRHAPCPVFVIRNPKDKYVYGWE
jgi:nucleotide-binding universal stress UspA family protein